MCSYPFSEFETDCRWCRRGWARFLFRHHITTRLDAYDARKAGVIPHPLRVGLVADFKIRMNRNDLQRPSKDDLIDLVLRLQRPDKSSPSVN